MSGKVLGCTMVPGSQAALVDPRRLPASPGDAVSGECEDNRVHVAQCGRSAAMSIFQARAILAAVFRDNHSQVSSERLHKNLSSVQKAAAGLAERLFDPFVPPAHPP